MRPVGSSARRILGRSRTGFRPRAEACRMSFPPFLLRGDTLLTAAASASSDCRRVWGVTCMEVQPLARGKMRNDRLEIIFLLFVQGALFALLLRCAAGGGARVPLRGARGALNCATQPRTGKKGKNYFKNTIGTKKFPKVLYGGSVNDKNISLFSSISEIDGFLIGGASQSSKKFIDIVRNYYK